MNHLLRSLAPISDAGWKLLDDEARERLTPALAARKLVDFSGPRGWEHSATNLGRTTPIGSAPRGGGGGEPAATNLGLPPPIGSPPCSGVSGVQRRVLPLVEARAEFELSRAELRDYDRGAQDADLEPLDKA